MVTCPWLLLLALLCFAYSAALSSSPPAVRVRWLIVGGGIHGVHVATRLLGEGVTTDLCIVDDSKTLLHKWKTRTAACGMEYLRSSAGYHLDLKEDSLKRFGQKRAANGLLLFARDYERPRLDIFNQHCDHIIDEYRLDEKHVHGMVTKIEPQGDHVEVQVNVDDTIEHYMADRVILALGNDNPSYPDWVSSDLILSGTVRHLLDTDDTKDEDVRISESCSSVAIVGGGISAAHKALELAAATSQQQATKIHLVSRNSFQEQQFDTHQDWMMDQAAAQRSQAGGGSGLPKRQRRFQATKSWQQRRQIIAQERIPGTVTAAVNRGRQGLQYAIQKQRVQWHRAEVVGVSQSPDDHTCAMELSSGETLQVDQILLATGFGKKPPSLVQQLDQLPVSEFCGYPIVDSTLQWGDNSRIFVTGALAELELGPSARNIAGARLAAERILQAAKRASGVLQ